MTNFIEYMVEYQGSIAMNLEEWTASRSLVCSVLVLWVRASCSSVGLKFPTQLRMTLDSRFSSSHLSAARIPCVCWQYFAKSLRVPEFGLNAQLRGKWFHSVRRKSGFVCLILKGKVCVDIEQTKAWISVFIWGFFLSEEFPSALV